MKINYALVSRVLIAILFVYAGVGKILGFEQTVGYVGSLGAPLPVIATILAILVEVPVAAAFAYGYKTRITGGILIAFTIIATLLAHRHLGNPMDVMMALKNIAIIGGIMAAIRCACGCDSCKTCKA